MAVQDDINAFINKAQQRIVTLGILMNHKQQVGERIHHEVWLIQKLSSAIIGLTNPNEFTQGEIYSIISYYNNLANLTPLGIAYFNPTGPQVVIQQKIIFLDGGGTYLLSANNLSDVDNVDEARINLGIDGTDAEYPDFAAYKLATQNATVALTKGYIISDVNNNGKSSYYIYSKTTGVISYISLGSTNL